MGQVLKNSRLKDSVAIIVGSSSGMGRATALTFAQEGAKQEGNPKGGPRNTPDRCVNCSTT